MEINLEADATGQKKGGGISLPFTSTAPPKVKIGNKGKGRSRIAALKVNFIKWSINGGMNGSRGKEAGRDLAASGVRDGENNAMIVSLLLD